jgi:hypothetical protein
VRVRERKLRIEALEPREAPSGLMAGLLGAGVAAGAISGSPLKEGTSEMNKGTGSSGAQLQRACPPYSTGSAASISLGENRALVAIDSASSSSSPGPVLATSPQDDPLSDIPRAANMLIGKRGTGTSSTPSQSPFFQSGESFAFMASARALSSPGESTSTGSVVTNSDATPSAAPSTGTITDLFDALSASNAKKTPASKPPKAKPVKPGDETPIEPIVIDDDPSIDDLPIMTTMSGGAMDVNFSGGNMDTYEPGGSSSFSGGSEGSIEMQRSDSAGDLDINMSIATSESDSATWDVDYTLAWEQDSTRTDIDVVDDEFTISFEDGSSGGSIVLIPLVDMDSTEDTEKVYFTIESGTGYIPQGGDGVTGDIQIEDMDYSPNITTDSNNDMDIDADDDLVEGTQGKRVFINHDDDNHDGVPDTLQTSKLTSDDLDLTKVELDFPLSDPSPLDGYSLTLSCNSADARIWWKRDKTPLDDSSNTQYEPSSSSDYHSFTWNITSTTTSHPFPDSVYVEGLSLDSDGRNKVEIKWELSSSTLSDTVEIWVEPVVWPSNESGTGWEDNETTTWGGFVLPAGWEISKTLEQYIEYPSTLGTIRTEYPEETSTGVWQGTSNQSSNAIIDIPDATDEFQIVVAYQFDNDLSSKNEGLYTDVNIGRVQADFFANSGIYIDAKCEIQLFDTNSLINTINSSNGTGILLNGSSVQLTAEIDTSNNEVDVSTTPVVAGEDYRSIPINKLITGIPYGTGAYSDFTSAPTVSSGSLTIDVERSGYTSHDTGKTDGNGDPIYVNGYTYSFDVSLNGGTPLSYTVVNGTGGGVMTDEPNDNIYLQSHWGSGVIFSSATISDTSGS